jgi:hypothetical protein
LQPVALTNGELVLEAPDEIRSWVTSNFARLLQAAAAAAIGTGATVRVVAPGAFGFYTATRGRKTSGWLDA